MKWLLPLLMLPSVALADVVTSVAVLDTPTKMPSTISTTRRSVLYENRGSASIFCSPSSSVTVETGFEISTGAWRAFPATVVWCIAAVSQAGTGTDRTLVWESDQ